MKRRDFAKKIDRSIRTIERWLKERIIPSCSSEVLEFMLENEKEIFTKNGYLKRGISISKNGIIKNDFENKKDNYCTNEYDSDYLLAKANFLRLQGPKGMFQLFDYKLDLFVDKTIAKKKLSLGIPAFCVILIVSLVYDIAILKGILGCFFVGYLTFLISMTREIKKLKKSN